MNKREYIRNPEKWIPKEIFKAYCGRGADFYGRYYDKALESKKLIKISWNIGAVLGLPIWLAYRRQWISFVSISGYAMVLSFLDGLSQINVKVSAGFLIAIALMSNGLMLSFVNHRYHKMRQEGLNDDQIKEKLRNKADRSPVLAFFVGFIALSGLNILAYYLGELMVDFI